MSEFSHDKPMTASNVAAALERNYRETVPYQWVREAGIQNPAEAGATKVHLSVEWQAVEKFGIYRRLIADDGSGIPSNGWTGIGSHPMEQFFNNYGGTGKPIGGAHENYGIGAKCTLLPWNKYGLVVISVEGDEYNMIWVRYNPDLGEYGLRSFETDDGSFDTVIEAGWDEELQIDWAEEFRTHMPSEIVEALKKERASRTTSSRDVSDDVAKRLVLRFKDRWQKVGYFARLGGKYKITPTTPGSGGVRKSARKKRSSTPGPNPGVRLGGAHTQLNLSYDLDPNGTTEAVEAKLDAALPKYVWVRSDTFDKNGESFDPGCIAFWVAPTVDYPAGLVKLNLDHPVYEEERENWTKDLNLLTEIADAEGIIQEVYGTKAVCLCAHLEHLVTAGVVPRHAIDSQYRTPQALTAALLGLVDAHARIAPALGGKLKRRQKGTP